MKRFLMFLLLTVLLCALPVSAEEGNVTYTGDAGSIIFAPGSEASPTDLFPEFKDVMPGDRLTQKITLSNKASEKVKVKVYLRALGAHEESKEFLSQLNLTIQKNGDNKLSYLFDGPADETLHLTDWVCLGTLYSGGKVDLDVTLEVPTSLDNTFKNKVGLLDWEFRIDEFPVEKTDPVPPDTGDHSHLILWMGLMTGAASLLLLLFLLRKKNRE